MTYTCTATRNKQTIIECGLSEKEKDTFMKKYKAVGYDAFYNAEGSKHFYSATDVLLFHKEHIDTTIELGLSDVENWTERRNNNG